MSISLTALIARSASSSDPPASSDRASTLTPAALCLPATQCTLGCLATVRGPSIQLCLHGLLLLCQRSIRLCGCWQGDCCLPGFLGRRTWRLWRFGLRLGSRTYLALVSLPNDSVISAFLSRMIPATHPAALEHSSALVLALAELGIAATSALLKSCTKRAPIFHERRHGASC